MIGQRDHRAGPDVAAIILAAGKGSRYDPTGERYKLLEPLPDGTPVLRQVCNVLLRVMPSITVVAGARHDEIAAALSGLPIALVRCDDAHHGMGASIRCGVAACAPTLGWLMMLGDMPYVRADTVDRVVQALRMGALISRPFYKGRPGHPVAFSTALTAELAACDPGLGLKTVIKRHATRLHRLPVDDEGCVFDIDRPEDL